MVLNPKVFLLYLKILSEIVDVELTNLNPCTIEYSKVELLISAEQFSTLKLDLEYGSAGTECLPPYLNNVLLKEEPSDLSLTPRQSPFEGNVDVASPLRSPP